MARYEHLPIFREAYDLTVHIEKIVRNFSRYHKYTLGTDPSTGSGQACATRAAGYWRRSSKPIMPETTEQPTCWSCGRSWRASKCWPDSVTNPGRSPAPAATCTWRSASPTSPGKTRAGSRRRGLKAVGVESKRLRGANRNHLNWRWGWLLGASAICQRMPNE